jgi:hypothetical protein
MAELPESESKHTLAPNGSGSTGGTSGDRRHWSSHLQSVAQISGVATIIAATVYALGVFTLVLPISHSYHASFPAAWYAVSMVPKTVVAGHGIKSLIWPSLALTVATTLFALIVLWLLYVMLIGWHHARLTVSHPAVNLTSLAVIYSLLGWLILVAVHNFFPDSTGCMEVQTSPHDIVSHIRRNIACIAIPPAILIVLLYLVGAVLIVARGGRYLGRLIGSKVFPSMSFSGFIFKCLTIVWLTSAFLASALYLENNITSTNFVNPLYEATFGKLLFAFVLLSVVAILSSILRRWRYIAKLMSEATTNEALPSTPASFAGLGGSGNQRIRALASTLLYSVVLFSVFCMAVLVAVNVLSALVIPLISQANESMKESSRWDEYFIPLIAFGAFASFVIMYRKGWKGLGRDEYDLLSQSGWLSYSRDLVKSMGSRPIRSGLLWSLGIAYVIALASAFLLAHLNPPLLPDVRVHELAQMQSATQGQEIDSQGDTFALLAHTEGYWYLIDEDRGTLFIVPDRDDKFIMLRLDEQRNEQRK